MMNALRMCLVIGIGIAACKSDTGQYPELPDEISLHWIFSSVDPATGTSEGLFVVKNNGNMPLSGNDWGLHFNQLFTPLAVKDTSQPFRIRSITGEYRVIRPTARFSSLKPGDSLGIAVVYNGFAGRASHVPKGAYIANTQGDIVPVATTYSFPAHRQEPLLSNIRSAAAKRYDSNRKGYDRPNALVAIVPRPVKMEINNRQLIMRAKMAIACPTEFKNEAGLLADRIRQVFTGPVEVNENVSGGHIVFLRATMPHPEGYQINTDNGNIEITAATGAGAMYAAQTIMRMIELRSYQDPSDQLFVQAVNIEDAPRFDYRGLHLDVSRNFHSLERIKRIMDQMAYYKLNKLLITLTNDEGWRLEIPGLPELTSVGAMRGHTTDEHDMLYPAYGSGPMPVTGQFYTREEFIELLKYAETRHIDVIPEIDLPGHARAAIKAMQARARKLSGQEAEEYLLHDPDDTSEYVSAQNYSDNVICVCRESTYRFVHKVISEVVEMYRDAGAELAVIHSGGDEVPHGAWQGSPLCDQWIEEHPEIGSTDDLHSWFLGQFMDILAPHDIVAGGWEEIVLESDEAGHNTTNINYDLVDQPVQPYVWNSVWGWGREDMAYRLANAGYEIVMCNSGALYFDLAYERHPAEPGLTWSGYVDTRSAFEFAPYDMFAVATTDRNGEPLEEDYVASKERLQESAQPNILGIQGQLWSETIDNSDMLDYYLFPKMLGLAERAWSGEPDWTKGSTKSVRTRQLEDDWADFASAVGWHELPRLEHLFGGTDYRIPIPGARLDGRTLRVNTRYPNLTIKYTTDGTVPDGGSALITHTAKVDPGSHIVLRAFDGDGRGGIALDLGEYD